MKHAAVGNWEPFSCSLQLTVLSDLLAKLLHLWQGLSACAVGTPLVIVQERLVLRLEEKERASERLTDVVWV